MTNIRVARRADTEKPVRKPYSTITAAGIPAARGGGAPARFRSRSSVMPSSET